MRLNVDFSALRRAVQQMGAQDLKIEFQLDQEAGGIDRIDIELSGPGIEVELKDVDTKSGLLAYKGRQILLYIQDHGTGVQAALEDGSKGRKYHVAFCKTLDDMQARGRYERYVATNDISGSFLISGVDYYTHAEVEGTTELKVCKNCLEHLNYQGYKDENKGPIFRRFSLEEFFATYSSFFSRMPSRMAGEGDGAYTQDWPIISGKYKADRGFRCESCGVDLATHKQLLHVHHRNGVKTDNSQSNLQALCADCHRRQPAHGRMFVRHEDMQLITRMRREQSPRKMRGSWAEVFQLADPAVHGILHRCRSKSMDAPEVGYELQEADGRIVGQLELAWPRMRLGVAVSEEDLAVARQHGWAAWTMMEALQRF